MIYDVDIFRLANYDLVIDTSRASADEVSGAVLGVLGAPPTLRSLSSSSIRSVLFQRQEIRRTSLTAARIEVLPACPSWTDNHRPDR